MSDTDKDKDLEETRRIMERLVKTPPDHKRGSKDGSDKQGRSERPKDDEKPPHAR